MAVLAVAFLILGVPLTAIATGIVPDPVSSLRQRTLDPIESPEGWQGGPLEELLADPLKGDDALLRMLDHIGATPKTAELPVTSHTLGLSAPAAKIPTLYEAQARASDVPLQTALLAYNEALEIMDEDALLMDPEFHEAGRLPVDVQVAIAILVHAISDASLLQREAVSGMSSEDYEALLDIPGMILSGRLDPMDGSKQADEDFAAAYDMLSQVDKKRIDESALIMVHTVSHAMPTLREWGERERQQSENPDDRVDEIGSLVAQYTPERIDEMDPIGRLDILADTLRMASGFSGVEIHPRLQPLPGPGGDRPLRTAVLEITGVFESAGLQVDANALEPELQRADALPHSMQTAVARIVTNQVSVLEANFALQQLVSEIDGLDEGDLEDPDRLVDGDLTRSLSESDQDALLAVLGDLRRAEVRVVRAVQQAAPTLEAWGLHWGREPSMLPASGVDASGRLSDAAAMGAAMSDPQASMQQLMRLGAHTKGSDFGPVEEPPLPPRGALENTVLELYTRYDLPVDADTRAKVAEGVEALPPVVEQNAARILTAQLDALDDLEALHASLDEEDRVALADGPWITQRLLEGGEISMRDVQAMRAHYEVRDRVERVYQEAAAKVAAAMDASVVEIEQASGLEQAVPEDPGKKESWYQRAWSAITSIQVVNTASAQSAPGEPYQFLPDLDCPEQSPLADCGNDVWFMDPILETVVVSGFEMTTFSSLNMGVGRLEPTNGTLIEATYARGQMLTLDLGGDDTYQNNAGGSTPFLSGTGFIDLFFAHPTGVSVAIDLGGNNRYEPLDGLPFEDMWYLDNDGNNVTVPLRGGDQGAGVGGIGFLWDRRGSDVYEAGQDAQGFGRSADSGPFGIGILLDGDGDDQFTAENRAQGSAGSSGLGVLANLGGNDEYLLTDDSAAGQGGAQGTGAVGLLVDRAGNDRYTGGMQGSATGLGMGALIDLEGDDEYDRSPGETFRDGRCWTSLRFPRGDVLNDPQGFLGNATEANSGGYGVFVDLENGLCSVDSDSLLPETPDAQRFVGNHTRDSDEDRYPDSVEEVLGTDESDGEDYPAGLPKDAPPGWPEEVGYPPEDETRQDVPHGSQYLVRIPGLFALGDAVDTRYPDCENENPVSVTWDRLLDLHALIPDPTQTDVRTGCNYLVSLDIGGDNTYENRGGSGLGVEVQSSNVYILPGLLVDVQGNDEYLAGGKDCVQGCLGMLIDLRGNDTFVGGDHSQGVARGMNDASETLVGNSGVLFSAGGDDLFEITAISEEAIAQGGVSENPLGIGIFLAVGGNDTFGSPSQGVINRDGGCTSLILVQCITIDFRTSTALFLNLGGNDTYQPVGRQGNVTGPGVAAFVDVGGDDPYVGRVDHPDGPDMSGHYNNRFRADFEDGSQVNGLQSEVQGPGLSVFWDTAMDSPEDLAKAAEAVMEEDSEGRFRLGAMGIHVGTAGPDMYTEDATLLLDPGGDDIYRNNAGGTMFRLDLESDPESMEAGAVYDPARNYPLAALHINLGGENLYEPGPGVGPHDPEIMPAHDLGGILTQGAGFLGTGILVDDAGDDTYVSRAMSQGFGLYGSGIVWDRDGDDTYRYDPGLVRRPATHDDLTTWTEFAMQQEAMTGSAATQDSIPSPAWATQGAWTVKVRHADWDRDCFVVPQGNDHFGRDAHGAAVGTRSDGSREAVFSVFDEKQGLWRLLRAVDIPADPCGTGGFFEGDDAPGIRFVAPNGTEFDEGRSAQSNQINPVISRFAVSVTEDDRVLWQDDRDGTWSLYQKRLPAAQAGDGRLLGISGSLAGHDPADSNQVNLDAHGERFVYQDDRGCIEGEWGVYLYDVSLNDETPLAGCGMNIKPRISASLAVWQTQGEDGSWDVAVHDIVRDDTRIATQGRDGDQYDPDVSGSRVLYTEEADGQTRIVRYEHARDENDDEHVVERDGAVQANLDGHPNARNRAVWVDTTGHEMDGMPVQSDAWEVHRRLVGLSSPDPANAGDGQSALDRMPNSQWIQGASFMTGRGILFSEGGLDDFRGDRFAQGAAASLVGPKEDYNLDGMLGVAGGGNDIDAYGALVNADGNNAYTARNQSQGVHFAREIVGFVSLPTGQQIAGTLPFVEVETMKSIGLLLDFRGNDLYDANEQSQGYGALTLGAGGTASQTCDVVTGDGSAPIPGCVPLRMFVVQSYGLFMDLGGLDAHCYGNKDCDIEQEPIREEDRVPVGHDMCGTAEAQVFDAVRESFRFNETAREDFGPLLETMDFNETFNETFEVDLWSVIEEDWPDDMEEDSWKQLLNRTVFEAFEQEISPIIDTVASVCKEVESEITSVTDELQEELTDEPAEESTGRNNMVWRQQTRDPPDPVPTELFGLPCGGSDEGDACFAVILHVGGIGMDLPLVDNLNRALREGANEVIEELNVYVVETESEDDARLQGIVELRAKAKINDQARQLGFGFERVEYFINDAFTGYLEEVDEDEGWWEFTDDWVTDSGAYPDGSYDVMIRAHYTHPLIGPTLGYRQNVTTWDVDNPPVIAQRGGIGFVTDPLDPQKRALAGFSPFPYAEDAPGVANVTFGISRDFDHVEHNRSHDGWVRIDVYGSTQDGIIDEDDHVRNVFTGTGLADEAVNRVWDGTHQDENGDFVAVPSGEYWIRISVTDRDPSEEAVEAKNRTVAQDVPMAVQSDTPHSGCASLADDDCKTQYNLHRELADGAGQSRAALLLLNVENDGVPGLGDFERFHVFVRNWTNDEPGNWSDPEERNVENYRLDIATGEVKEVAVLGEDAAGNLECLPACGARTISSVVRGGHDLLEVLERKLEFEGDSPSSTIFRADFREPEILSPAFAIDGERRGFPGQTPPRVGSLSDLSLEYVVREDMGTPEAIIRWESREPGPDNETFSREDRSSGTAIDVVHDRSDGIWERFNVTWTGWSDLVGVDPEDDISWPEGLVRATIDALDSQGNRANNPVEAQVILDRTAPVLTQDVRIGYPDDQFHVDPDDPDPAVEIFVEAEDPPIRGFSAEMDRLRLELGDSPVIAPDAEREGCILLFEPQCFRPSDEEWSTTIPINQSLELEGSQIYSIPIFITDVAGNTLETVVNITVGAPRLSPQLEAETVDIYEATLEWSTARDAIGFIRYGPSERDLGEPVHFLDENGEPVVGTQHEFHVPDLDAGTQYVYRFFAVDLNESREAGPLSSFSTLHGVNMTLRSPDPSHDPELEGPQILSGLFNVNGTGWVQSARDDDGVTIEPRVVMRLFGPGLADTGRVVFDGNTNDDDFAMDLVTDALEDGVFTLEVSVSYLGEDVTREVPGLLVDNTAPDLDFMEPANEEVTGRSPDRLLVRVTEELTPIDTSSVKLRINGVTEHNATATFMPDGDAHNGIIELKGLPELEAGIHRLDVFAEDDAKNPGFAGIRILLDPEAPEAPASVQYPGDQEAARPGQWITLQVSASDSGSGVRSVTANTTEIGGSSQVAFMRESRTYGLDAQVPNDHGSGVYTIPIRVQDAGGNVRSVTLDVDVDAVPPEIQGLEMAPVGPGTASMELNASEPVKVALRATAAGLEPVSVILDDLAELHVAHLEGVQAGAEYEVTARVLDRAGHEAITDQSWVFQPEIGDAPPVTNLTATATPRNVELEWDDAGEGFRYAVHRAGNASFETVALTTAPAYVDQDVEPGYSYRYFAQALDPQDRHGEPSRVLKVDVPEVETGAREGNQGADVSASPEQGIADETKFVFTTTLYAAGEEHPPVWLVLDGETRRMTKNPGEDCRQGCTFRHVTTLPEVDLRQETVQYHVEVFDATGAIRLPESGTLEGPAVIARDGDPDLGVEEATGISTILLILTALASAILFIRPRRDSS